MTKRETSIAIVVQLILDVVIFRNYRVRINFCPFFGILGFKQFLFVYNLTLNLYYFIAHMN